VIENILPAISENLSDKIISNKPLSGSSISSAYLLKSVKENYFLKINSDPNGLEMFHAEQNGLLAIRETETIAVPNVQIVDKFENKAIIIMDYIESKLPDPKDYMRLGTSLAQLHSIKKEGFGFNSDNFIGSLYQSNKEHSNWSEFFWNERISPQFNIAIDNGLLNKNEIPSEDEFIDVFNQYLIEVTPTLLHGDFWGGNYIISTDGTPYLIDPAVYCGHSMVDIAMSKLFGSFGSEFYESYHKYMPKSDYYQHEIDIYQLYFLLVHLNLFGRGYYSSVSNILNRYFK